MYPSLNKTQIAAILYEAATRIEEMEVSEPDEDTIAIALTKDQWGVVLGSFDNAMNDICSSIEADERFGNGSPFEEDSVEYQVERQGQIREIEHLINQQLGRFEMGDSAQDAA